MVKKEKKKRGGQPGNQNALKHGYYSKLLDKTGQFDYISAGELEGIDEEIKLLRAEIIRALESGNEKYLKILVRGAVALDKLVRTRYQISSSKKKGLKDAVNNVIRDIFVPLGINIGSDFITKKII